MSQYKRNYQQGGNYFFTLVTYNRRPLFKHSQNVNLFKASINKTKINYPFRLNAFVILPDHLHCLWKLPKNDNDFSTRWRLIKRYFSIGINTSINGRKEKKVWQRRFWEHTILNEEDWQKHMDYIHYNPVKHGLVKLPNEWKDSSFHYWVEKGIYEKNWGSSKPANLANMDKVE